MAGRFDNASVKGLSDVVKAFRRAPEVVQERMGEATQKSAFSLLQRAKARVPVRHGFLKRSLEMSFSKRTGQARVGIVRGTFSLPGAGGSALLAKGARSAQPTKYGHLVEFGHGGPRAAPAHPFMRPAAEAERDPFLQNCRAAGRLIERDMEASRATQGGRFL